MRSIDYETFAREKKERFFSARALLGKKRGARRKIRDAKEREALMIMDRRRLERWIREGTVEFVSPRHIIVRLSPED